MSCCCITPNVVPPVTTLGGGGTATAQEKPAADASASEAREGAAAQAGDGADAVASAPAATIGAAAAPAAPATTTAAAGQAAGGAAALGAKPVSSMADLVEDQMGADHGGSSACGPTAAAAFSRFLGKDVSVSAAVAGAEKDGYWNASDGMGGYQTEVQLLGKLGVKSHATDSVDWDQVRKTVQSGVPVILATGKHYWVAEEYDAKTGRFNFGKSGSVFRNEDRTWYTPKEMEDHGPAAQHAIFLDGAA